MILSVLLLAAGPVLLPPGAAAGEAGADGSGLTGGAAEALRRPGIQRHIANPPRPSSRPEVQQRRSHYSSQVDGAIRRLELNRGALGLRGRDRLKELRRERGRLGRARHGR